MARVRGHVGACRIGYIHKKRENNTDNIRKRGDKANASRCPSNEIPPKSSEPNLVTPIEQNNNVWDTNAPYTKPNNATKHPRIKNIVHN